MIFAYRIAAITLVLSLVKLSGCESATAGAAVGANRSQPAMVSSEQFDQMAAQRRG